MTEKILEIKNLRTYFFTDSGEIPAVNRVSISLAKGEIVGIVGESGCGKSVTSLSVMGLVPKPPGEIVSGQIVYKGEDLTLATDKRMREIRGNEISMIFQEPMTSLDPVFTIGSQMVEAIRNHNKISTKQARQLAVQMLERVGIPRAAEVIREYPHQLSGGMRQRVMIAMAMSCDPQILIADEPTTALDVTIQAQILDLMRHMNDQLGTAILLITHDLGVVAEVCQRVIVMYAGQVVEEGDVRTILKHPAHPYTKGLIQSLPKIHGRDRRLYSIPGQVPKPGSVRKGCTFADRCQYVRPACHTSDPDLYVIGENHMSRCFLHEEEGGEQVG